MAPLNVLGSSCISPATWPVPADFGAALGSEAYVVLKEKMKVEDEYADVLQNIELSIVVTYREHPEMSDYDVMRMLEALMDGYVAEKIGRAPRSFGLSEVELAVMQNARKMCEWRLGRGSVTDHPQKAEEISPEAKAVDEILLCLKRILKSVKKWNKDGGRQGYLNFIVQYVK